MNIGILALQGDVEAHADTLARLGVTPRFVRRAEALETVAALVIPGGESTTMSRLIERQDLLAPLQAFAAERPVFGTCAGLVLMARDPGDPRVTSLGLLDIEVSRNAYGRQIHSFTTTLEGRATGPVKAVFIRAPRIEAVGPEVEVLLTHAGHPVLVAQGPHLGCAFHPELNTDPRLHAWWLKRAGLLDPRESAA
ncbi:MAG: pyridoxal 5'-phosphate synthase glutaminase subunit PdxT [Gammaproteobacteria bacterium]|nr:MAG: pyridoxal 5'-phosphate synthase glutaminase subunit PdxT [Gammaproteobacteria bacterium]